MSSPTKDTKASPSATAKKAVEKEAPKTTLELLEEDDEFQEFDGATWEDAKAANKEDGQLWKDDWDDDDNEDTFSAQLRAQIAQK